MTDEETRRKRVDSARRYYHGHRDEIRRRRAADRRANPEHYRALDRANYVKHADEAWRVGERARVARYYQANREAVLAKRRAQYAELPDEVREKERTRLKSFREANRERIHAHNVARYARERDIMNARSRAWAKAHPWKGAAQAMKRFAAQRCATPAWADFQRIRAVYQRAAEMTAHTGVPHEVDHIIPIQGRTVCGLHVHHNLQILRKIENQLKGNQLLPEIARHTCA